MGGWKVGALLFRKGLPRSVVVACRCLGRRVDRERRRNLQDVDHYALDDFRLETGRRSEAGHRENQLLHRRVAELVWAKLPVFVNSSPDLAWVDFRFFAESVCVLLACRRNEILHFFEVVLRILELSLVLLCEVPLEPVPFPLSFFALGILARH